MDYYKIKDYAELRDHINVFSGVNGTGKTRILKEAFDFYNVGEMRATYIPVKDIISSCESFPTEYVFGRALLKEIRNGFSSVNALFWDCPETNVHPKLIGVIVDILLDLHSEGAIIYIATNSYVLKKEFDLKLTESDKIFFHELYVENNEVLCDTSDSYLGINENAIGEAFDDLMSRCIRKSLI